MEYRDFLLQKVKPKTFGGLKFNENIANPHLFDFQRYIVELSLRHGCFANFGDCGTGKTMIELEIARQIVEQKNKRVLVITPLAVSGQHRQEAAKFNFDLDKIDLINYESLHKIDPNNYVSVLLDESSILKNYKGKIKQKLISAFKNTPYCFPFTATPSPNDYEEIGNHSEFIHVLDSSDMRQRFFVRDNKINEYRLKEHAKRDFFAWINSWAVMFSSPSDLGFDGSKYILPELNIIEERIETKYRENGRLFNDVSVNATNFNKELRLSMNERISRASEIANGSNENFIIWVKLNSEADALKKLIPDAIEVRGDDNPALKEERLLGFANNEFRVLITKPKIAQFGLNYQNCHNQIFASLDFSFESLYQAIRRSYRFGQRNKVNMYLITTDTMQNVVSAINLKQSNFEQMKASVKEVKKLDYKLTMEYEKKEFRNDKCQLIRGDSVEEIDAFPDNYFDFSIFSPPFSTLYTYSDNLRDMGNCENDKQFFEQYRFLVQKLFRKMRPGRLVAVHTKDLAVYKNSDGYTGIKDFTGENLRLFEECGFKYHSKVTIWTDPVLEMQRTKTQRLLYKQVRTDSSLSGVGLAEYLTIFRKWDGIDEMPPVPINNKNPENFPLDLWQKWASPVWFDIRRTDVLNGKEGTAQGDEKHIAPLQLEVIRRAILMWSNEGETVFTPFLGIGSEVYEAVKCGRYGIGIELKDSYFDTAVKNCRNAITEQNQLKLFAI